MSSPNSSARRVATTVRQAFVALPPDVVGEILDGELHVSPRPRAPHSHSELTLGSAVQQSFGPWGSGPGGWVILIEPGLEFEPGDEVSPDVAGWKREGMPALPTDKPIQVVPDWACEVVAPSTKRYDRDVKKEYYARHGVRWLWFLDPLERTLAVWELARGKWAERSFFNEGGKVRAKPFDAIELDLERLWPSSLAAPVPKHKTAAKKTQRRRSKG